MFGLVTCMGPVNKDKKLLYTLCENLGKSNKATYAVVAGAVAKGLFRPFFALADKKEDPETKKYAAIREGLTEIVAIPTYIGVAKLAEMLVGTFNGLNKEKMALAKHNANFLGVCIDAMLVIPALTTVVTNPLMVWIKKHGQKKNADININNGINNKNLDIVEGDIKQSVENITPEKTDLVNEKPYHTYSINTFMPFKSNLGMKVGGLW